MHAAAEQPLSSSRPSGGVTGGQVVALRLRFNSLLLGLGLRLQQ